MKALVERDRLLGALSLAASVAARKSTLSIVTNVCIEAGKDGLRFTATDLDMMGTDLVAAQVDEPGALTVSAVKLHSFVEALSAGGQVQFACPEGETRLEVTCGRARLRMPALPAADFPRFDSMADAITGDIEAGDLMRLLDASSHAMSEEETRPALCGVRLHIVQRDDYTWLRAIATDGFLLGWSECDLPKGLEALEGVTIPKRAVIEFGRLLDSADGPVQLSISPSLIRIDRGSASVTSKVVAYPYPDYIRVVPATQPHFANLPRAAIDAALKRLRVAFDDRRSGVRIRLEPGRCAFRARSSDTDDGEDEIEADVEGAELDVSLNARFLQVTLDRLDCATVRVGYDDSKSALTFRDPADDRLMLLVMPQAA